jgi:hypothetical protein
MNSSSVVASKSGGGRKLMTFFTVGLPSTWSTHPSCLLFQSGSSV